MSQRNFDIQVPKTTTEPPKVGDIVAAEPFPGTMAVADESARAHPHIYVGSELAKMAETRRADNAKYEASEKGKAARVRARVKLQVKRTITQTALAEVKRGHMERYNANPARFSKAYTVFTAVGVKQTEKDDGLNSLNLNGVSIFKLERWYGTTLARHATKDGFIYYDYLTETPQCVEAGVPRWRDSILNPAYRKLIKEMEESGAAYTTAPKDWWNFSERATYTTARTGIHYKVLKRAAMILGVSLEADAITVRKAYLELAKLHHPDHGGDPAEFRAVQQAYESTTNNK